MRGQKRGGRGERGARLLSSGGSAQAHFPQDAHFARQNCFALGISGIRLSVGPPTVVL